ncbi:forespore capture DNA-binding protein RefZ [Thalassorhabdus alkalitolerans]|uniref:Forespore capture DNA-binding protein RefZ n=1 Tax=Thalassorhabdus alkalitolerans TaxID=2282697 RepID=A0ABW0YNB2_9BACI|nr:forespore capture DNA-binding protein RefZ [Thalassobacillus sp. C254]
MSKKEGMTKRKVMDAATFLFNTKGFHGTSVRAIAEKANINVSLISYYFGGKQGLLENLMTDYLEGYLHTLEKEAERLTELGARRTLLNIMESSLEYMQKNHHRSRFVLREMTLDSVLVRELMSTYFMKEKHMYSLVIQHGIKQGIFARAPLDWTVMYVRGMVTMPFLHPQYIREVFHLQPQESYFLKVYMKELSHWVDHHLIHDIETSAASL